MVRIADAINIIFVIFLYICFWMSEKCQLLIKSLLVLADSTVVSVHVHEVWARRQKIASTTEIHILSSTRTKSTFVWASAVAGLTSTHFEPKQYLQTRVVDQCVFTVFIHWANLDVYKRHCIDRTENAQRTTDRQMCIEKETSTKVRDVKEHTGARLKWNCAGNKTIVGVHKRMTSNEWSHHLREEHASTRQAEVMWKMRRKA